LDHWIADEGLLYNNVGFMSRKFPRKGLTPFSRTPLSFGAPVYGTPANIRTNFVFQKLESLTYILGLPPIIFLVGSVKCFSPEKCVSAVQRHPRSLIFVRIGVSVAPDRSWWGQPEHKPEANQRWNYFRSIPSYVITVPERHRQTEGWTDRQIDDILWHNRALHTV